MTRTILRHPAFWAWMLLLGGAVGLSAAAGRHDYFEADLALARFLQTIDINWFHALMVGASYVFGGWQFALVVLLTAVMVWNRAGKGYVAVVLAVGLIGYGHGLMKLMVGRPRPAAELINQLFVFSGLSFPSGHAFSSSMLLGTLIIFMLLSGMRWWLKALGVSTLAGLLLLVGVSRVYLGAHWPSDVLGAYLWAGVLLIPLACTLRYRPVMDTFFRQRETQRPDAGDAA